MKRSKKIFDAVTKISEQENIESPDISGLILDSLDFAVQNQRPLGWANQFHKVFEFMEGVLWDNISSDDVEERIVASTFLIKWKHAKAISVLVDHVESGGPFVSLCAMKLAKEGIKEALPCLMIRISKEIDVDVLETLAWSIKLLGGDVPEEVKQKMNIRDFSENS